MKRIDAGISRDVDFNAGGGDAIAQQRVLRPLRGREMPACDLADHAAVELFGKRRIQAVRAQPRLHMGDGNALIERRNRGGHGGGGVPLHDSHINGVFPQGFCDGNQRPRVQVGKCLAGFHQLQVDVRGDGEQLEDRAQHFAMLTRCDQQRLHAVAPARGFRDQGGQLDGLRPCAEHECQSHRLLASFCERVKVRPPRTSMGQSSVNPL